MGWVVGQCGVVNNLLIFLDSYTSGTTINEPWGMHISGNYLFVAADLSDSLAIFDVSGDTISYSGYITSSALNGARDVVVSGNYAYMACSDGSVTIVVDVTSKTSPTIVTGSSISVPTYPYYGVLSGNKFIVTSDVSYDVTIVDYSTISSPTISGSVLNIDTGYIYGIDVSGNYAYVVGNGNKLNVIDHTTPAVVGSYTSASNTGPSVECKYDATTDHVIGFSTTNNHLWTVDVSTKSSPTFSDNLDNPYSATGYGLAIVPGKYALAMGEDHCSIYDISDPTNLSLVGVHYDPIKLNGARQVYIDGQYLYTTHPTTDTVSKFFINLPV